MKLSALLRPAIDAKLPHEVIMEMVLAYEAEQADALEKRRQSDRERQQRQRDKSRDVTLRHSDRSLTGGGDARGEVKTSNSENNNKNQERNALSREFAVFWGEWPNKVGKPKAEAAFRSARKQASLEAIMAGLRRYVASKPADRAWLNPATFLNQERYDDQPASVQPQARGSPPLRMEDFLGTVIEQQERRDAGPDQKVESAPQALRAISGGRWAG